MRDILDVLEAAGVDPTRGKMVCPKCDAQKVSANSTKGIAKCWGCGMAWTVKGAVSPPELDWATHIVSTIAGRCKGHLPNCQIALDWLEHRRLPIEDTRWLSDNDLGAVPWDIDVDAILAGAKMLWAKERQQLCTEAEGLRADAKALTGKRARKSKADADRKDAAIKDSDAALESIAKVLPILQQSAWRDAVVYIYRDAEGNPCSLNLRQIASEPDEREVRRIQPLRRGVFGVLDALYEAGDGWKGKVPTLTVVEGEHNLLSLRALTGRWNPDYRFSIPVIAIGGKNGADIATVKIIAQDDQPLVIYDNDKVDPTTGWPGGYELVDAVSTSMYCQVTTTPDGVKDLDDFIKARPALNPQQLLDEVFGQAAAVPVKFPTVAAQVAEMLDADGLEVNAREIAVTNIIVSDVKRRAKLYNVDGEALLLLPDGPERSTLINVRKVDLQFASLMRKFGISRRDWVEACVTAVNIAANAPAAPRVQVHDLALWTGKELYINCYDGSMVNISVAQNEPMIQRVPVGTNDVLMHRYAAAEDDGSSRFRPWLSSDADLDNIKLGSLRLRTESLMDDLILDSVTYASHPEHYKQILKAWLMFIFFSSNAGSKPLLMMEGPHSTFKSSVGHNFGTMLIGPKFKVNNAPETGKEVGEKMSGTPFVVMDEWDTPSKQVELALKYLSTGGADNRRKYYETYHTVELPCEATVMLTSNSNPMRQPGGSRRMFVIPLAPRQSDGGARKYLAMGEHITPKLLANRSGWWLELLGDLANCVLAHHATDSATETVLSMADFGVFVERTAQHEGWGVEARAMFNIINERQEDQSAQSRVVLELLTELLIKKPVLQGKSLTAAEWTEHLQTLIPDYELERKRKVNKSYVAYEIRTFSELFVSRLNMVEDRIRRAKVNIYSFRLPVEKVLEIGAAA
jgi:ribosomal protein L37AE/L43A